MTASAGGQRRDLPSRRALRPHLWRIILLGGLLAAVLVSAGAAERRTFVPLHWEITLLVACICLLLARRIALTVLAFTRRKGRPAPPASLAAIATEVGRPPDRLPARASERGIDWEGLIESVAIRLEDALGPGFYAHGYGHVLYLSHADSRRRISLAELAASTDPDGAAIAMRMCMKMLDNAQMFKMQQLRQPWPRRGVRDDASPPVTLPRPRVRLADFELHMAYVDELGPVLSLPSLPFVEGHPEPDGPVRL